MTIRSPRQAKVTLGRDVILVAEASEAAATLPGIEHPISENGKHIEAGIYLAEEGSVSGATPGCRDRRNTFQRGKADSHGTANALERN